MCAAVGIVGIVAVKVELEAALFTFSLAVFFFFFFKAPIRAADQIKAVKPY